MADFINPSTIQQPGSLYSHGVIHPLRGRRLVISGQLGIRPNGTIPEQIEEQIEVAWDNLIAVLDASDFKITDIVKLMAYATVPGSSAAVRDARARRLGTHAPAATFIYVAGLVDPRYLFELEAEAIQEAEEA